MRAAALLALLLLPAPPALPEAEARITELEVPAKLEKRGSGRLRKGRVIILEDGRPEVWRALEKEGEEPRKVKRLRKGRPWRVMVGRSPREDAAWVPKVTKAYSMLKLEATGYDPGPESNGRGNEAVTVTGARARFGVAAVDPKVIPLKTLLYIEGYGTAQALDIGGAIKGKRIDLCFNSTREADAWGRKKGTRVWLLGSATKAEAAFVLGALSLTAK